MGSKGYSTLMELLGEVVTEGVTEAELRVKTTEEEQGEEGLETSYE